MDAAAEAVRAAGCRLMRGGAFCRAPALCLSGVGGERAGLSAKRRAPAQLPIVTELMDVRMLEVFLEYDVDVIQIGARNMQTLTC